MPDPLADHLITPENAALLLIDYQPSQLAGVRSMDHALLVKNAVSTVRIIKKRYREQEPRPVRPKEILNNVRHVTVVADWSRR